MTRRGAVLKAPDALVPAEALKEVDGLGSETVSLAAAARGTSRSTTSTNFVPRSRSPSDGHASAQRAHGAAVATHHAAKASV